MAQDTFYKPINSMAIKANTTYTASNIPSVADVVVLQIGVRLTDQTGEKTPLRGIRMTITDNESLASSPKGKVPFIWIEGESLLFDSAYSYTPLDNGVVAYGMRVAI